MHGGLVTKSRPTLVTPQTVARQAPLSMGFPGKNTGVGCPALLQGIFPNQGSNLGLLHLLHFRNIFDPLNHLGSPTLPNNSMQK